MMYVLNNCKTESAIGGVVDMSWILVVARVLNLFTNEPKGVFTDGD